MLKNYQNKKLQSWTIKDTEDYFQDILNNNEGDSLRVMTSKDLTDEEDFQLQSLIANWYFQPNLKRTDNFLEDVLKNVKLHTKYNDFFIQVYVPVGQEDVCFGLKFEAIIREGIIQIGVGSFHECMLKGLNHYLVNEEKARSMIIIKAFDPNKPTAYKEKDKVVTIYEKDVFHFIIESGVLYGVDIDSAARIQEHDFTTQEYLGKEQGITYVDTNLLVAELEVDNLMYEVGIHLLNH